MKNLIHPKWVLFLNSIPLLIFSLLLYSEYRVIKSLLNDGNIYLWNKLGLILCSLLLINIGFAGYHFFKKTNLNIVYALFSSASYLCFAYYYYQNFSDIIPSSIPNWMVSGNLFIHMITFIMPTLIHSIIILTLHFTRNPYNAKIFPNFIALLGIPIGTYLLSQIGLPILHQLEENFSIHVIVIAFILVTYIFIFFLIRFFYLLALKKEKVWVKYKLLWMIPVCIVFPLIGLLVNNGIYAPSDLFRNSHGIFGNFNAVWFYVFAFFNGVLLCLPKFDNYKLRLLVFVLKVFLFAYIIYFLLVFLPYLPFSLIGIVALGLGFLMLTPIMIFVIQAQQLHNDYIFLKRNFSKSVLQFIYIVSFLGLPSIITIKYINDRKVINDTLEYVYNPNFEKEYNIDLKSLENTLFAIKTNKKRNDEFIFGENLPYLNSYFNWLVLDNLILSNDKIKQIDLIFFNQEKKTNYFTNEQSNPNSVKITSAFSHSVYDKERKFWKSTIDLEITNFDSDFSEYSTQIYLPNGCYISDYYLYVGNKKKYGLLTEKKAALWVYNSIRNENKDPGLLYYINKNKVSFKVFPFSKNEKRKTGIELLHKEPIELSIENQKFNLGEATSIKSTTTEENNLFVLASEKKNLEKIYRKPYYHFIIDASKNGAKNIKSYNKIIDRIHLDQPLNYKSKISYVNALVKTYDYEKNGYKTIDSNDNGFYLDRGIKQVLFDNYKNLDTLTYPIIVVLTDELKNSILENDFTNYMENYFEEPLFYNINSKSEITSHSLLHKPLHSIDTISKLPYENNIHCLKYSIENRTYLLKDDNQLSLLPNTKINWNSITEKNWINGLKMQSQYQNSIFYPNEVQEEWHNLIRSSFSSHIMNPYTSFIVVENEAQQQALLKKQEKVLKGNKALDLDEETNQMSEPSIFILIILVLLITIIYKQS